jgi:hypothetical protein
MERRAQEHVREGEPIIPDGPVALTQDIQDFKSLVEKIMGYEIKPPQQNLWADSGSGSRPNV